MLMVPSLIRFPDEKKAIRNWFLSLLLRDAPGWRSRANKKAPGGPGALSCLWRAVLPARGRPRTPVGEPVVAVAAAGARVQCSWPEAYHEIRRSTSAGVQAMHSGPLVQASDTGRVFVRKISDVPGNVAALIPPSITMESTMRSSGFSLAALIRPLTLGLWESKSVAKSIEGATGSVKCSPSPPVRPLNWPGAHGSARRARRRPRPA